MNEIIQSIYIKEIEIRKDHVVYKIQVNAAVRTWTVEKRYSEFCKLDAEFYQVFSIQTPIKLPSKRYFPSTFSSLNRIEERRHGLEMYLRAILSDHDDRWRLTDIWQAFLCIPIATKRNDMTTESWLDEYEVLTGQAREIRACMNKKAIHLAENEVSALHQCTVKAKKLWIDFSSRLNGLESSLNQLVLSDGEQTRRQDLINNLKTEKEALMAIMSTTTTTTTTITRQLVQTVTPVMKPTNGKRVFGKVEDKETLKNLNNEDILVHQTQFIKNQDQQLLEFQNILSRQKQIGIAIGHELENQQEILKDMDEQLDKTHLKLKLNHKKLQAIN